MPVTKHGHTDEEPGLPRYLADVQSANRRRSGPHYPVEGLDVGDVRQRIADRPARVHALLPIDSRKTDGRPRGLRCQDALCLPTEIRKLPVDEPNGLRKTLQSPDG